MAAKGEFLPAFDIGSQLVCHICSDKITDHRVLPCQHHFCRSCLDNLTKNNIIRCPVCSLAHNVQSTGVGGLPKSPFLLSYEKSLCEKCLKNPQHCDCGHCQKSLCMSCFQECVEELKAQKLQVDSEMNDLLDLSSQTLTGILKLMTDLSLHLSKETQKLDEMFEDALKVVTERWTELRGELQRRCSMAITQCKGYFNEAKHATEEFKSQIGEDRDVSLMKHKDAVLEQSKGRLEKILNTVKTTISNFNTAEVFSIQSSKDIFRNTVSTYGKFDFKELQPLHHTLLLETNDQQIHGQGIRSILESSDTAVTSKTWVKSNEQILASSSNDKADVIETPKGSKSSTNLESSTVDTVHEHSHSPATSQPKPCLITPLSYFGSSGGSSGKFISPTFIAYSHFNSTIVVSDPHRGRFQVFDENGKFLFQIQFDEKQSGIPAQCSHGVAVTDNGDIILSNTLKDQLLVYSPDGHMKRVIGGSGEGEGMLLSPRGVVANKDLVYVCDTGNSRIQVFRQNGSHYKIFGVRRRMGNWFPVGIDVSNEGFVFVVDQGADKDSCKNERRGKIEKFNHQYKHICTYDLYFRGPRDLAIGPRGTLVVSNSDAHELLFFNSEGHLVERFAGSSLFGFSYPTGVCCVGNRLCVVDQGHKRVHVLG